MTYTRIVIVLIGGLAIMLGVVILRSESARFEHQTAESQRRAEVLRGRLRDEELELARLRNPALIRERAKQLLMNETPPAKPTKPKRQGN